MEGTAPAREPGLPLVSPQGCQLGAEPLGKGRNWMLNGVTEV